MDTISELVPLSIKKIMQTQAYTAILLGTDEKAFAIYTEPHVGEYLQKHLTGDSHPRPLTCDFINSLLKGLDVKVIQVVINHLADTVYFARIFFEQTLGDHKQIIEMDARPSDCLTIAILNDAPIFCKQTLFEQAIPADVS